MMDFDKVTEPSRGDRRRESEEEWLRHVPIVVPIVIEIDPIDLRHVHIGQSDEKSIGVMPLEWSSMMRRIR